ncbi:MAG: molybdate ABC transporter substrate-binding protein [Anaerolineaceae bacterium]|nr:molybdate ABC transporter substrate-binding protein [Anaerolineaceae bacterium]
MKFKMLVFFLLAVSLMACSAAKAPVSPEPSSLLTMAPTSLPAEAATPKATQALAANPIELHVFAAASLTETMQQLAKVYESKNSGVKIVYTLDSSGTLKTQIQQGAVCDLFISAAQKQMNQLEAGNKANTESLDFVAKETRVNLVENKVTLVVPKDNPAGVTSFKDIVGDKVKKIALGNKDVPVGQYSEEILKNLGIWDSIQAKVTLGSNVKEVTTWVSSGVVDCGIVYATDAFSAGLQVVDEATAEMLKTPVVYPAAVMKASKYQAEAKAFLDFLQTPDAQKVFEDLGFAIPEK